MLSSPSVQQLTQFIFETLKLSRYLVDVLSIYCILKIKLNTLSYLLPINKEEKKNNPEIIVFKLKLASGKHNLPYLLHR